MNDSRYFLEAIRDTPTHIKALLTAGIVSVCNSLLSGFPLQLCKYNADIEHSATHWGTGIKFFRRRNKVNVVLLEQFHEIGKVQNGAGNAVELIDNNGVNQALPNVLKHFLKMRSVNILT